MSYLPIIYVRGYAGTQSEVEQTVDDPFHGFNLGSTHIRQDQTGDPERYFFESPLLRLISDHRYAEVFNGYSQEVKDDCADAARTLWIYRYYDVTSRTYTNAQPERLTVEKAAQQLLEFIDEKVLGGVRDWYGRKAPGRAVPSQVILVAHSMGGLVCRSLIEKILPDKNRRAADLVAKLFTFGTPHGGIHFDGLGGDALEKFRDFLGVNGSDSFGHKRMQEYLRPNGHVEPKKFDPQEIADRKNFPPSRIFCLVGTNARDYDVLKGASSNMVGPQSDGLVQIEKAYVYESHRAYVHRSHSGRYGMVNSEEGYLNLERFLFGNMQVKSVLRDFDLRYDDPQVETTYFIEIRVVLRGKPVSMHTRALDQYCAVPLSKAQYEEQKPRGLPLFTSFLWSKASSDIETRRLARPEEASLQYAIHLAVHKHDRRKGWLPWTDQMDRLPIWSDFLLVRLEARPSGGYTPKFQWRSEGPNAQFLAMPMKTLIAGNAAMGSSEYDVAPPAAGKAALGPNAVVRFTTSAWE